MAVMTITIQDKTAQKLREAVIDKSGKKKGVLGDAIEEAINNWLEEKNQRIIAREAIEIMEKGFNMGKIKIKTRGELYE